MSEASRLYTQRPSAGLIKSFAFAPDSSISTDEAAHARQMEAMLNDLQGFSISFGSAASLLDYCRQLERSEPTSELGGRSFWWKFNAGRDGAMSLYHLMKTIEGIRASMNKIPTYRLKIKHPKLRTAQKYFEAYFPRASTMRTAIAHLGEISDTTTKRERNFIRAEDMEELKRLGIPVGPGTNVKIDQCFSESTFIMTFEGELITYSLTMLSWQRVRKVVQDCLDAFVDAGTVSEALILGS